jgi:putative endonuclease
MHFIYVLYSRTWDKYYVGETENPEARLIMHNTSKFKSASTTFADDWQIKLLITTMDRIAARKVERFIKSMKSKTFLHNLISRKEYFENFKEIVLKKLGVDIL